ncbi:nucleotidyltransferase family protein [Paenibacillus sp. TRM 82003]|nr:nucleotidyltransferase family protein [Paenibacillus sp. TRM 82003]
MNAFPRELNLLLEIMSLDNCPEYVNKIDDDTIDWERFIEFVKHHRVFPIIYTNLKKSEFGGFPDQILNNLKEYYVKNTFHMMHLTREMGRVCDAFHEATIQLLVLKGPVLATELYGDMSLRTSKDLDVLVPVERLEKAETLLRDLGYQLDKDMPRNLNDWKWRAHHLSYSHPVYKIQVELHWRQNPEMGNEEPFNKLWERRRRWGRQNVYYLSYEDLFVSLAIHGARHAWFRLRWLYDIDKIIKKDLNWDTILHQFGKYENLALAGQTLRLANKLFQTPIPEVISHLVRSKGVPKLAEKCMYFLQDTYKLHPVAETKELHKEYRAYLISLMTNRQKMVYLLNKLRPSSYDAAMMPLPKILHFLYIPLRPILWIWRRRGSNLY